MRRFLAPALLIALLVGAWLWRRPTPQHLITFRGSTMGTTYMVKLVSAAPIPLKKSQKIQAHIDKLLGNINHSMSTYDPTSEISRFNKHPETTPVLMSAPFLGLLKDAHDISEITHGAFDVTVGPLVNAWGFGPDEKNPPTDSAVLAALRERVGYTKLIPGEGILSKTNPGVYVDLSAIAKGYGVDVVFDGLQAKGKGFNHLFVEIGGEVRAHGQNEHGKIWKVGIEKPSATARAIQRAVPLKNTALATSGDYRNFYEQDGKRISHTIDPRTGKPITHRLASVTVLHARSALADAWATALNVLGPEEGFALAEKQGLAAFFLVRDDTGGWIEKSTKAFIAIAGK